MRVLHFVSWYPSKEHDQLGNFIQRHIEAIGLEHDCSVVYARTAGRRETEVRVERGVWTGRVFVPDRKPRAWRVNMALERLVKQELIPSWGRPDLVHLHVAAEAAEAAVRWAKRWDVPLVVTEHWTAYLSAKALTGRRQARARRALNAANILAPVSAHLGRALHKHAPAISRQVIPNVVDCEQFELGAGAQGAHRFFHVSSLNDQQKNVIGLLEAFAQALSQGADAELVVAGSGDDAAFQSWARDQGLESRISFLGRLTSDEVAREMAAADALVLFSRAENMPCVMVEAWAAGTPVIATDVGGIGEFLTSDNGILLDSEDVAALADAMAEWNRKQWDRQGIRSKAQAQFSRAAIAAAYTDLYCSLTASADHRH
ncbi:MAG: glycosyltransferase family 4 protein [Flavobacteriales bacterium]|nr:glycosyltransferase family 4 protein [Flavobacteriales bacterium]